MTGLAVGGDYSSKAIHLALVGLKEIRDFRVVSLADPPQQYLVELRGVLGRWNAAAVLETGLRLRLYLEEPWARAETGIQTAIKIDRPANYLEAMAYLEAVEPVRVPVAVWRSHVLGYNPRSAEAKRAVINHVRLVYGLTTRDDNLADAVGLGAYGYQIERFEPERRRA